MARPTLQLNAVEALLADRGEMRAMDIAEAMEVKLENVNPSLIRGAKRGRLVKRNEGRAVFYRLPDQEPGGPDDAQAKASTFNAALWADGDLVLVGVELNADGASVTLNAQQTAMLRRLLGGA